MSRSLLKSGEEHVDWIALVACTHCGIGGDGPTLIGRWSVDPFGGGHSLCDAPDHVGATLDEIDVSEPDSQIAAGLWIAAAVVRDPVGLRNGTIPRQGDELIGHEVHRGVEPLEEMEGPVDELGDGSPERTMGIGGFGMETVGHRCSIASIDASAIPKDEFGDLLFVDHRSDREVARGGSLAGPGHAPQRRTQAQSGRQ